jgi:hypothetical protein
MKTYQRALVLIAPPYKVVEGDAYLVKPRRYTYRVISPLCPRGRELGLSGDATVGLIWKTERKLTPPFKAGSIVDVLSTDPDADGNVSVKIHGKDAEWHLIPLQDLHLYFGMHSESTSENDGRRRKGATGGPMITTRRP